MGSDVSSDAFHLEATTSGPPRVSSGYSGGANSMLGRVYGVMAWFIFMKQTIPLIDYFGGPVLVVVFLALLWLQWCFPLRRQQFSALRRIVRNLTLSIPSH